MSPIKFMLNVTKRITFYKLCPKDYDTLIKDNSGKQL